MAKQLDYRTQVMVSMIDSVLTGIGAPHTPANKAYLKEKLATFAEQQQEFGVADYIEKTRTKPEDAATQEGCPIHGQRFMTDEAAPVCGQCVAW